MQARSRLRNMKEEFPRHFLEARVVIFAADSITVYGMPQEKFKIL